jgi:hypothetical protein
MLSETLAQIVPMPPKRTLANHTRPLLQGGQRAVAGGHIGKIVARSNKRSNHVAAWLAKP